MQFSYSFKHMDSSHALREYAESKIREQVNKFVTKPIKANVTFETRNHEHIIKIGLSAGDGFNCQVEQVSTDMYAAVDLVNHKLEKQLRKTKEKLKHHKDKHSTADLFGEDQVGADEPEIIDAQDIIKWEAVKKKRA